MTIGDILIRLREARKLTQQELARELRISPSYLSLLENRKRPVTKRVFRTLAKYFRVPAGYLVLEDIAVQDLSERHREIVRQIRRELVEPALQGLFDEAQSGSQTLGQARRGDE